MDGKILIVDDDIDTLQLVGTMLEQHGFEIVEANDGEKALELAPKENPDLILLDIMLPDIDGYEVTRRLRSMTNTAFTPIIMFTAKAQVDDKVEGFEAGADDYLTKPTHPAELLARVRTVLMRPKSVDLSEDDAAQDSDRGLVIGVMAAKGGLGVSTLTLNMGVCIHQQTKEYVTVAELRPGRGDIGVYLGYTLAAEGLNKLLRKDASGITLSDVENELVTHGSGIQLLLSSFKPSDASLSNAVDEFKTVVKHLAHISPYAVLDLGASLTDASAVAIQLCDILVVIVEPTGYNIVQTKALLKNIKDIQFDSKNIKIVLFSRVRMDISVPTSQIQNELGHSFAGQITPAPELAYQATERQQPLTIHRPDSLTSQQIRKLASSIIEPVQEST
ncbi:MAG: response regulator [Chloroflexi bacterium]|nr:response regulator [Chloroflexota bacterium]